MCSPLEKAQRTFMRRTSGCFDAPPGKSYSSAFFRIAIAFARPALFQITLNLSAIKGMVSPPPTIPFRRASPATARVLELGTIRAAAKPTNNGAPSGKRFVPPVAGF